MGMGRAGRGRGHARRPRYGRARRVWRKGGVRASGPCAPIWTARERSPAQTSWSAGNAAPGSRSCSAGLPGGRSLLAGASPQAPLALVLRVVFRVVLRGAGYGSRPPGRPDHPIRGIAIEQLPGGGMEKEHHHHAIGLGCIERAPHGVPGGARSPSASRAVTSSTQASASQVAGGTGAAPETTGATVAACGSPWAIRSAARAIRISPLLRPGSLISVMSCSARASSPGAQPGISTPTGRPSWRRSTLQPGLREAIRPRSWEPAWRRH
jgi:hypothetical protein